MSSAEDIFRQQVITLLSRCNNDVPTLLKSITRSLNESGRNDVRVELDPTGTVVTVAQSPYHVSAHQTTFQQTLQSIVNDAKAKLAAIVPPKETLSRASDRLASPKPSAASTAAAPQIVAPAVQSATPFVASASKPRSGSAASRCATAQRRSFAQRSLSPQADSRGLSASSYSNGNYLIRRYGGHFPAHANYGFYRRYGAQGRGAATSEFHNLPMGVRPSTKTGVYS